LCSGTLRRGNNNPINDVLGSLSALGLIETEPTAPSPTQVYDTFYAYNYDWTSTWCDITDKRQLLSYQWVSQPDDIWGLRPKYETYEKETKVVEEKNVTVWKTVPVTEDQTILQTTAITDTQELPFGEFSAISILAAGNLDLDAAGNVQIKGVVQTETGELSLQASGNVTIEGVLPSDLSDPNTLAAQAKLTAPDTLAVTAGGAVHVADSGLIQVTDTQAENRTLNLTASQDITFAGEAESTGSITLSAKRDVTVSGTLTAAERVDVLAGQGVSGVGNVTTIGAHLKTTADNDSIAGSGVNLTAGANRGDILLTAVEPGGGASPYLTAITAQHEVRLTAGAGSASAETYTATGGASTHEALITADLLTARAASGMDLKTDAARVDAELSGAGDIRLTSPSDLELAHVETADGSVFVTTYGDLTASDVSTLGPGEQNDVYLTTRDPDGAGAETANLTLASITVGTLGDVILDVQGGAAQAAGAVVADALDVTVQSDVTMTTRVNSLAIETQVAGDVNVTQQGTGTLTVSGVKVMDGSFTLTHASGEVILADVELASDRDTSDITVTTGGDIQVGWIKAGSHYESDDDVPAPAQGDDPGASSKGDVILTAGGSVTEAGDDAAVDLVADQVTITAATGITGIELAANELLSVTTATGDIELYEQDGAGEKQQGLVVTLAQATAGSVTVTARDYLEAYRARALGTGGIVRLASELGNLTVGTVNAEGEAVKPAGLAAGEEALEYTGGVALSAAEVLLSYRFFDADEHLEYRAGKAFDFDLPASLGADTIVLDLGPGLKVDGTLTAKDLVELASDTNVYVSGTIQGESGGNVTSVKITARGTGTTGISVRDEVTGLQVYVNTSDPNDTVLFDPDTSRYYRRVMGGKHVFQGTYIPAVEDTEPEVRTYFADNADGSGTLYTSTDGQSFNAVSRSDIYDLSPHVWEVTSGIDPGDYEPKVETTSGGDVNIQDGASVKADRYEIRAAGDIDMLRNDTLTVSGFVGGLHAFEGAEEVYLSVDGHLHITGGILSSQDTMTIIAQSVTMDAASVLMAPTLTVTTDEGMTLYTMADTITATADTSGNITIKEADAVTLQSVTARSGSVDITAGGSLTVDLVETVNGGDITLKSGADMAVDRVETVTGQGQQKTSGAILLDAYGQLGESSPADNDVDVFGHTVTLKDSDGSVSGLEVQTPDPASQSSGTTDMNAGGVPSWVDGDYVLMAPTAGAADVDLHVTGNLNVISLGTSAGQTVALSSDGDMVVAADLNVGNTGTIDLDSEGSLSVGGRLTAGTLNIGAVGDLVLTDLDVGTITFDVTGGSLSITNASSLVVGAGNVDGGLQITSDGTISINDNVTAAGDVIVSADGAIAIADGKVLDAGGFDVTLIAGGGVSGQVDAVELNVQAAGVVNVRDINDVIVTGFVQNAAGSSVTVTAGGGITLATDISSGGGNVTLDADGGTLQMTAGTAIDAGSGDVALEASSNVSLTQVSSSGTGAVSVTSQGGSITGPLSGTALVIPTGTVQLVAATGIGQGDGLDIEAASLIVENTSSGAIRINEADGLDIQGITQAGDGAVSLSAGGTMTCQAPECLANSRRHTRHRFPDCATTDASSHHHRRRRNV